MTKSPRYAQATYITSTLFWPRQPAQPICDPVDPWLGSYGSAQENALVYSRAPLR